MSRSQRIFPRRAGFTLVEVLISIAIAMVLILGISKIFSVAQQATGAGNAVISTVEKMRAVEGTLAQDFRDITNAVGDSPGIAIVSYALPAFRSAADKAADRDGKSYTMNDPVGTGNINLNYTQVNDRVHRIDKLVFFARDHYPRVTGDGNNLTTPSSSEEAMILLGHAAIPNNAALQQQANSTSGNIPFSSKLFFNNPADPNSPGVINDNNAYASSWILAREVMLLSPNPPAGPNHYWVPSVMGVTGDPLASWSVAPAKANFGAFFIYSSRFDVALTSIAGYRQLITNAPAYKWWEAITGISTTYAFGSPTPPNSLGGAGATADQRYQVNPFLIKPNFAASSNVLASSAWLSTSAAQAAPAFVRGCTQFIVEFAGDFVTQSPANGAVLGHQPDGQIDYTVDPNTNVRQIRWYGFPRQSSDEGKSGVTAGAAGAFQYGVAPLRDTYAPVNGGKPAPIERCLPTPTPQTPNMVVGSGNDGYASTSSPMTIVTANSTMSPTGSNTCPAYVCAWGPDTDAAGIPRPKMIRIIMAVDDPAGHLNTQQVYEFVYNLP